MSAEHLPLAGAAGTLRTLVDGSVRLSIDFEPKDRAAVMAAFGAPGTPVAVVRLRDGFDSKSAEKKPDPRGKLCMDAIGLCNNADFQRFVARNGMWKPTPEAAKGYILATCAVNSRKDIDGNEAAEALFRDLDRRFSAWLREQSK